MLPRAGESRFFSSSAMEAETRLLPPFFSASRSITWNAALYSGSMFVPFDSPTDSSSESHLRRSSPRIFSAYARCVCYIITILRA